MIWPNTFPCPEMPLMHFWRERYFTQKSRKFLHLFSNNSLVQTPSSVRFLQIDAIASDPLSLEQWQDQIESKGGKQCFVLYSENYVGATKSTTCNSISERVCVCVCVCVICRFFPGRMQSQVTQRVILLTDYSCALGGGTVMTRKDSDFIQYWNEGFSKIQSSGRFAELCKEGTDNHGKCQQIFRFDFKGKLHIFYFLLQHLCNKTTFYKCAGLNCEFRFIPGHMGEIKCV